MDQSKNDLIASLRTEYSSRAFTERDADADPIAQFRTWLGDALEAVVPEPTAMTLATASPAGRPSARIVLLKGVDDRGFVFYSNYESRKGSELDTNAWAALVFFWVALHRQIRIGGRVERVSPAESDVYFASRPRGSQIGAWASTQSAVIPDRESLEARVRELESGYAGLTIPRPAHWGGYRLEPVEIEFWQGRPSRLHDRLRYGRLPGGSWRVERLAP